MPLSENEDRSKNQPQSRFAWLPQLSYQVWILALGRLLSQIGSGFTLFYAPIFFVNKVGLAATAVGLGLGSASISGILGRVLGGSLADTQTWGRKKTVLLSALISAIGSLVLAVTANFPIFVVGNLLAGLGLGLYWPATEALVADLASSEQRNEAYAINRLADHLGLGLGVVLGGILINTTGAYRSLFVVDAISFLVFWVLVSVLIHEVDRSGTPQVAFWTSWKTALQDRALLVYVTVNILITTYIAQLQSTVPLYFSNFVTTGTTERGFSSITISALFTWHLAFTALCQLPVIRLLHSLRRARVLMLSVILWGIGFTAIWQTGTTETGALPWAVVSMGILAIATITYTPIASAIVVDLAPPSLRGVYLAVNSQCWAIGYFIGPPLGGFALDHPRPIPDYFWLGLAISTMIGLVILQRLDRMLRKLASNRALEGSGP